MAKEDINSIREAPLLLEVHYLCHSKTVALVLKVCKRFRTEETQNEAVLVHHTAEKQQSAKRMTTPTTLWRIVGSLFKKYN